MHVVVMEAVWEFGFVPRLALTEPSGYCATNIADSLGGDYCYFYKCPATGALICRRQYRLGKLPGLRITYAWHSPVMVKVYGWGQAYDNTFLCGGADPAQVSRIASDQ